MKIEHVALWTPDLEKLKQFYVTYFDATANDKYSNPRTGFNSYFLSFDSGARLEVMQMPGIPANANDVHKQSMGWIHLAIATGSEAKVDALTARLKADGYSVLDGPRRTGDGYYESVVLDPDRNRIEITV